MKKYRKFIFIIVGVVILGAVGITQYMNQYNAKKITTFTELFNDSVKGREITSLMLNEYSSAIPPHEHNLRVEDKEKIERVIDVFSELEMNQIKRKDRPNSGVAAYHLGFSHKQELIFALIVSDKGRVDTYDFEKDKRGSYWITNNFDFESIERLFELEND